MAIDICDLKQLKGFCLMMNFPKDISILVKLFQEPEGLCIIIIVGGIEKG